jgi:multiple sugar transport system permease protein
MTASTLELRKPRQQRYIPLQVLLGFLLIYFLIPFWWVIVNSSKSTAALFGGGPALWFSGEIDYFGNLVDLFTYGGGIYARWLANSALYAIVGGIGATALAALAGYGFAKYRFAGRRVGFAILLGAVMVPTTALVIPTFMLMSQLHLTNTIWAVILPSLLSPFGVYLMTVYAREAVPDELLEASRLDGAGEIRTFFTVSIRLMTPALVTMFLFQFVAIWNNFFLPMIMLRSEDLFPVVFGLYNWNNQLNQLPELRGLVLIGALLSVIPLIVTFLLLQRFWRNGLGAGALK